MTDLHQLPQSLFEPFWCPDVGSIQFPVAPPIFPSFDIKEV